MMIQAFLSGPAFNSFSYSTDGVNFTTVTTSNWYVFKDYLNALDGVLPAGWSLYYDQQADRVKFRPGSGSLQIRFESQSQAEALGFSSTLTAFSSSTITGDVPPAAACPLNGAHFSNPIPGKKPELRTFRHSRGRSVSWGSGTRYAVNTLADYANADRILGGPLSTGKVRIGDYTASTVYGPTTLGGYLDGFVTNQPTIEVFQGDVEQTIDLQFVINAPAAPHNSTDQPKDPFFGQVERGYSFNFYALIEGLPFRFVEVDTGISDSDRTVSASLIIDDSQASTQKVDRFKAVSGASGATIGILDPLNELGIFDLPTFEVQIEAAVEYDDTSITLAASTDALPSSGVVYLGNECLKYTGNTGSGGSPANTLTGITRPFGPGYSYGTATVQKFKTVTNSKKAWEGSTVRLFAQLLDPFGRAVDSTWEGTYTRQMGAYSIKGLPGYDGGIWVLECEDLIRRLNREAVASPSAQISPFDFSDLYDPVLNTNNEAARLIVDNRSAVIVAEYRYSHNGDWYSGEIEVDLLNYGSPNRYSSFVEAVNYVLNYLNGQNIPESSTAFGITYTIGEMSWFEVVPEGFRMDDDGKVIAQVRSIFDIYNTVGMPANVAATLTLRPQNGQVRPSWLEKSTIFAEFTGGVETLLDVDPGFNGFNSDFVVIDQPFNNPEALGTFPASGFAIFGGESNEDGQLVKYTGTASFQTRTILTGITRLEGNPQSTHRKGGEVTAAEFIEGSAGQLIATILESSGFDTGARGTFDTLGKGFGYALKASEFVNDSTTMPDQEFGLLGGPSVIQNLRLALTRGKSLDDLFSGILSSFGLALAWVRSGIYLKIGSVGTMTVGQSEQYTITDSDLIAGRAATIRQIGLSPNLVKISQSSSMLGKGGASYTYRIIEDIQARGVQSQSLDLFGLDSSSFFTVAEQAAARLADGSFAQTAYELTVSGDRDYLAGQLVRLDLSYPGIWDFQEQTTGLTGLGRILEVTRNLTTNRVKLVVLVNGTAEFLPLCPVAFVTSYNRSTQTITVTDAGIFNNGDTIRVEMPGVNDGSGHSTFDELTITGISGNDITLSAILSFTPGTYTVATYVQDDNASIPQNQLDHVHVSDGSRYA